MTTKQFQVAASVESRLTTVRSLVALLLVVEVSFVAFAGWPEAKFPGIPLFGGFNAANWQRAVISIIVSSSIALVLAVVANQRPRGLAFFWYLVLISLPLLAAFLSDQHWLQPWAWQAFVIGLVDAFCGSNDDKRRWWMRLACSIYIFSAISKLDVAFIDNLGRVIVAKGLAPALGLDPAFWSIELKRVMAASMPVVELAAGIALWTIRWRRFGLWLATAMHVGLLTALGPLGLDHHAGVLLWNLFFVVHIWVLFHRSDLTLTPDIQRGQNETVPDTAGDLSESEPRRFATREAVLAVLLLMPIGEPFGLYDHWPGWSVYSNRPPLVRLEVAFPKPVEGVDWIGAPEPLTNLQIVSLSGWSYAAWRTPAYPQERFQLAVIKALLNKLPDDTRFRVRVKTFSPWRTGQWTETVYETRDALAERLDDFWLPTTASAWSLTAAIEATLAPAEDAPAPPTTAEPVSPD